MLTPEQRDLLRRNVSIDGDGNVVGNDNTVRVTKQTAGDYAVQIGEQHISVDVVELRQVINIQDSQVGIIGDHAHVEGGVHFHRQLVIYEGAKNISAGDLLDACQTQVDSVLYNARHKYTPDLYVNRAIERELNAFFDTALGRPAPNCFLLVAPAGSGKTNLLCELARVRAPRQPVLLFMGGSTYISGTTGLLGAVKEELEIANPAVAFRSPADSLHTLHRLAEEINRDAILFLDAINEHDRPAAMRQAVEDLLRKTRSRRIKLLVTCRDYYWGLFKGDFWKGATVNELPAEDDAGEDAIPVGVDDFSHFAADEHERALDLYLKHYGIAGRPVGDAAEQCRHPLLLRFFCEAYRGQAVGEVEDIRLKELFDRYWEQKLASIAGRMIKQGEERLQDGLAREVGGYLLNIAAYMLHNNVRAVPLTEMTQAAQREEQYDDPRSVYGRIRDEFIILEERERGKSQRAEFQIAFVYEEFMEYVMARSLMRDWDREHLDEAGILAAVKTLTGKYDAFAQILGVMVYLALMLKEERDLALWSLLLNQGPRWQEVVFEAFRKLPEGQIDGRVVDAIEQMLRKDDEQIQIQVLDLLKLQRIGEAASRSSSLVKLTCDFAQREKESIARRALLALSHMPADATRPALTQAICHKRASVRDNAVKALTRQQQPVVELLTAALQGDDKTLQLGAVKALEHMEDARAVETLAVALKHDDPDVRLESARALGEVGGDVAMESLVVALEDEDESVRRGAAKALGRVGDKRAVPSLIAALEDPEPGVRSMVTQALSQLRDVRAVQPLITALNDDVSYVRAGAASALGELRDARAVDPLIAALKDPDSWVRYKTAKALWFVRDARAATALITALTDKDESVREEAFAALEKLGKIATEPIIAVLKEGDRDVQYRVAKLLITLRTDLDWVWDSSDKTLMAWHLASVRSWQTCIKLGDAAVEPLIAALEYGEPEAQAEAAKSLGELKAARAVEPLLSALENDDRNVRLSATEALGEIGDARAAEPLVEALKDDDGYVQTVAGRAIRKLGDAALEALVAALADEQQEEVRREVRWALARLGEVAVKPLVVVLNSGDEDTREEALQVLFQIGTPEAMDAAIRYYKRS